MVEKREKKGKAVALTEEDKARLNRLREEIHGRIVEMSLIGSRTLGKSMEGDFSKIELPGKTHVTTKMVEMEGTTIICWRSGGLCICIDEDAGEAYFC